MLGGMLGGPATSRIDDHQYAAFLKLGNVAQHLLLAARNVCISYENWQLTEFDDQHDLMHRFRSSKIQEFQLAPGVQNKLEGSCRLMVHAGTIIIQSHSLHESCSRSKLGVTFAFLQKSHIGSSRSTVLL